MYKRTTLGDQEILGRHLKLSARLRTLLLLIESDDLKKLDEKIANPQYFSTLLELGLITYLEQENQLRQSDMHVVDEEITAQAAAISSIKSTQHKGFVAQGLGQVANNKAELDVEPNLDKFLYQFEDMSFADIRDLMRDTLKQYCGLMAKQLILAIENSHSVQDLRYHQKKWLTSLFETKIPRQRLTLLLQQINHHLQNIDS